jgi:type IV secretory pathway VirB10-like protein
MWATRASLAVAAVLTLCCAAARSDDGRKPPSQDVDPGFLEFLGSVDRLADVNPDYLAQPDPPGVAKPARSATPPPPPPPPPQPAVPPSASAAPPAGPKNE